MAIVERRGTGSGAVRLTAPASALAEQVAQFAEDVMRGYDGTPPRRAKYFRDALHGSIVVEPHEAPFVDAPLFQRLRGILQTGPVYLTYPSARHSRFEHSLGVMHLAGRMVARPDTRGPGRPVRVLPWRGTRSAPIAPATRRASRA